MNKLRSLPLCVFAGLAFCSLPALAQQAAPAVRIVNPIDESQRVTLTHTVHPLANAANDRGAAPDGMQLDRLQLVLQRSPSQEAALRQLIQQMHMPGSPSYHQWLTPDQFGAQFGASDQDIATITSWLGSHGFSVSRVNPGKGTLEFSGSVAQLRDTFHTQIHKYVVNGETHYANANDPQIPAALAPVISGFTSLNNFHPKSYLRKLGQASYNPSTHQATPTSNWTWGNASTGTYYVLAPGDFAMQYNVTPLYNSNINGSGESIAIINDSNVNINLVNQFRTLFGLPANPPQIVIDGNDPGVDGINNPDGPNYDSFEAYLDVEWSGAVAPDATIDLVIAADTALESGLILAMEHAVYGNVAPVISMSFGACEADLGATNSFINSLWEQAAAQGITPMISAGDSGSAGCDDDDTQEFAVYGQAVNGFASTPYNVAVGGTDFYYSDYNATTTALQGQLNTYWSSTATTSPAVSILQSPIPEQPWNDSQYGDNIVNYYTDYTGSTETTIAGGSGGASNDAYCSTGYTTSGSCSASLTGYPKPAWQTGSGVPTDGVRDLPDVSLFSANGQNLSFYPICAVDGDCQTPSSGGIYQISGVGGTSASAPSFAGIMALVDNRWGRQGLANTILYPLKTQYPAAFNDITIGTNSVPCEISPTVSTDCIAVTSPLTVDIENSSGTASTAYTEGEIGTGTTAEYNAAAGYNLATGLGTINANNLVTDWGKITLATTTTTMTPSSTSFAHGTAITISGAVTGSSPTGNVALMTDSSEPLQQGQGLATVLNGFDGNFGASTFALSGGAYSGSVSTLPGGSYNIWASYGGDGLNAMSTSTKVPITVTPEASGVFFQAIAPEGVIAGGTTESTAIDYGTQLVLSAQVAPSSQLNSFETCTSNCPVFTIPTGTVTFTDTLAGSGLPNTAVVNAEGDAEFNAPFAVGSHSVTASYNGDQSYNKSSSSAIGFTISKDTPQILPYTTLVTSSTNYLISGTGQQTILTIVIENNAQYSNATSSAIYPVPVAPPTGTVTLTTPSGTTALSALTGTFTLSSGVDPSTGGQVGIVNIAIPANTASGSYGVEIAYSGDANYYSIPGSSNTSFSIPIQNLNSDGYQASTLTATASGSISPNSSITVSGTVTGVTGHGAPTGGVVYIFSSGTELGAIGVTPGIGITSSFSFVLNSQSLFQGANFVTLQYSGDNVYNPSTYVLYNNAAINNPLADFSMVPETTIVPVSISGGASSGTDTINTSSVNGFTGAVNLTCAATTPLTCGITPNPSLSNGSTSASTLTINVPASTPNGNYNVVITGVDSSGEFVHTLAITAEVSGSGPSFALSNSGNVTIAQGATTGNTSTITVTPAGGFTGNVTLSCVVTPPTGAANPFTCSASSFSADPVDVTSGTGTYTSQLTISTTSTTTAGAYSVVVTGTDGALTSTTTVDVTVNLPADFALSSSGPITTTQGATSGNTSTITATPSGGFTGTVILSCAVTTAPSPAANPLTCGNSNLNPTSVALSGTTAETSVLTASTTSTTTTGSYVITVTGTAGTDVHTTTVNVTVNSGVAPTFTVTASSPSAISPGNTADSTVTVSAGTTGYAGSVALSCTLTTSPSGASDLPTCSMTGSPVTLTSNITSTTATAVVSTTAATAKLEVPLINNGKGWLGAGSGAILALLVFFGIPARRRSWRSMLTILVAMVALGALASCGGSSSSNSGGGSPSNPGTTAGSYTFTVTGTGTPSVSGTPSGTFTVSVN